MGTDIHGFIRNKKTDTVITTLDEAGLGDRNYTVFAALAGVRNGFGFAGCYRHEPVEPLAEQRGLPESRLIKGDDFVCPENLRPYWYDEEDGETVWLGDHSYTHFTLKELLDWIEGYNPEITFGGVLSEAEYAAWDKVSTPSSYCGGIAGRNIVTVSEADYQAGRYPEGANVHIQCHWASPLKEKLNYWVDAAIEAVGECDPGDAEFIVGFDS